MKLLIRLLLKKLPSKLGEKLHSALWQIRARAITLMCPAIKLVTPVWGGRFPFDSIPRGIAGVYSTNAKIIEVPGPTAELSTDAKTLGKKRLEEYDDNSENPKSIILAVMPNAIIDGATGAVLNTDHALVTELSTYAMRANVDRPWDHPVFYNPKRCRKIKLTGDVVLLTNPNAHVYFHWLLEILPRLGVLEEHGLLPQKFTCLVPDTSGFFLDSLKTIGIDESNLVRMQSGVRYQIDHLITTSDLYPQGMVASYAPYLHKTFLQTGKTTHRSKLIYISRRVAGLRPVINESRLTSLVQKLGGEVVILEGMTMCDQAALFHSAEVIVAAHGSALSNLVFCKPGTKVVELFSGAYVRKLYPFIGSAMKLDYWYIIGSHQSQKKNYDSLYGAIEVDESLFEQTLLRLLKQN